MQATVRGKVSLVQSVAPKGARGIATHTTGVGRGPPGLGAFRNVFTRAHNIVRHTIPRLTQLLGDPPPSANPLRPRLYHKMPETIHNRLSMSSRMALSRPLKAAGMPRPPMIPRPMHEVGLGTARKFSSQSGFQHIVQSNTSITARAFWEADWDLKAAEERKVAVKARRSQSRSPKSTKKASRCAGTRFSDEMSIYFPEPSEPAVTTFLQIALAPTPTNAMPPVATDEPIYLLPLRAILNNHTTFQARAQDVAAIFEMLDANHVWDNNVNVESWGDTRGLCVELRIKFRGWPEERVRQLLGSLVDIPGCSLQEVYTAPLPSVLALESTELENSLENMAPLEFVMPGLIVSLESIGSIDISALGTRPTSPSAFSFISSPDEDGALSDTGGHESDGLSTRSFDFSDDDWHRSILHVPHKQPTPNILSLSSMFLSRLEDSQSLWNAE